MGRACWFSTRETMAAAETLVPVDRFQIVKHNANLGFCNRRMVGDLEIHHTRRYDDQILRGYMTVAGSGV